MRVKSLPWVVSACVGLWRRRKSKDFGGYDTALSGRHWFQQTHWRGGVTKWSVIARPKYTRSGDSEIKPGRPPYGHYGGEDVRGFLPELERGYPVH